MDVVSVDMQACMDTLVSLFLQKYEQLHKTVPLLLYLIVTKL